MRQSDQRFNIIYLNTRGFNYLPHDSLTPLDGSTASSAGIHPSSTTLAWNGGDNPSHFHLCPACGESWDCSTDGCRFPVRATCLQCWAAEGQGEALPGATFVVVSLAAGLLILVAFAMAVLW